MKDGIVVKNVSMYVVFFTRSYFSYIESLKSVFATSNGTKKLSEPLLSRFRVMHLNEFFTILRNISQEAERFDNELAHEIAISVWKQLPNPNIRNCWQIGRLVRNE